MVFTLEDLINYGEEYEHRYFDKVEEGQPKGIINFREKVVKYNPLYNEEGETFCHEMVHHHFRNVYGNNIPEFYVESEGLKLYQQFKEDIDLYIRGKLQWDTQKERDYNDSI